MKYEEVKIGDVFRYQNDEETVISKSDKHRVITTIDCDGGPTAWLENQLHFLKPIKEELPEEGLLASDKGSLVYKLSDGSAYGFSLGYQSNYFFNKLWEFHNGHWRKATEQEKYKFIEMLKKECEGRGLFEYTRIEKHANGHSGNLNANCFESSSHPISIYNKNGQIFHKGKFATPIKEEVPTLALLSKACINLSKFGVEIKQVGNMLMINPIKK